MARGYVCIYGKKYRATAIKMTDRYATVRFRLRSGEERERRVVIRRRGEAYSFGPGGTGRAYFTPEEA
jgi:hypothetical protein